MKLSKQIKEDNIFPNYNINEKSNCILHFGVGNFHRAHQALYVHEIIEQNKDISIIGVNLRSNSTKEKLEKQDYLYSLVQISDEQKKVTIINSIKEILYGLSQKEKIRGLITSPEIKLITLTVTEKGYHFDENKNLLFSDEITNDLKDEKLLTVIGHLSLGLIERFKKNKEKIIILSCDNLSENGSILKNLVRNFIQKIEPDCLSWLEMNVDFPLSVVDGIVPNNNKTSEFFNLPYEDNSIVVTEPYREWYIQSKDKYLQSILSNDKIHFVDDVSFYENIKLKILNASHSALAYIGHLLGYVYVHEAINDETCYKFISNFLDKEVIPTLPDKNDFDIGEYKNKVLNRFKNSFIEDKLLRIAIDGSYKIPIRIVETFKKNKNNTDYINLIITAWLLFIEDRLNVSPLELKDPNNQLFMNFYTDNKDNYVKRILELQNIFNINEAQRAELQEKILENIKYIKQHSLKELMSQIIS
jgi:mannitol-1-phosphate/altronate dehydrogenase